jgi:hypothetical protein
MFAPCDFAPVAVLRIGSCVVVVARCCYLQSYRCLLLLNNMRFSNADSCVTLLTLRTRVSRRYLLRRSVPIVCIDLIFF